MSTARSPLQVIGLGGAGCNAVERMIQVGIDGVEFIAANTDAQALALAEAPRKIPLGPTVTRGLGTGGDPSRGAAAAEESRADLQQALASGEIIFIAAGLGGGTGTGAAPLVAELIRELGGIAIAVVSMPFAFEGARRRAVAQEGLLRLSERAHTVIAIPNDRLVELVDAQTSLDVAFRIADDVLRQGVQGIAELITRPGLINLDLAHVKTILGGAGRALFSMGQGRGEGSALKAAQAALVSPLTDVGSVAGARGVLVNVMGGPELSLAEVREAVELIAQAVSPDAEIVFGTGVDPHLEGRAQVTLIAVGMEAPPSGEPLSVAKISEPVPGWLDGPPRREEGIPFQTESDLDIPAFIRRRRPGFWKES